MERAVQEPVGAAGAVIRNQEIWVGCWEDASSPGEGIRRFVIPKRWQKKLKEK